MIHCKLVGLGNTSRVGGAATMASVNTGLVGKASRGGRDMSGDDER